MKRLIHVSVVATALGLSGLALGADNNLEKAPIPPKIKTGDSVSMKRQAGIGSQFAYAEAGVLEVGGSINYSSTETRTDAGITPSIGYFVADNFQMSALTNFAYSKAKDQTDEDSDAETDVDDTINAGSLVIEPSMHVPLNRTQFVFAGVGAGAYFAKEEDPDFALAPRIGFKNLTGRSGMLSVALQGVYAFNENEAEEIDGTVITVENGAHLSFGYSVLL
jgi:hypothetical protein